MTWDPTEYRPDDTGPPNEDPPEVDPETEQRDELAADGYFDPEDGRL